jgi:ZIP family zinc transporter
MHVYLAAGLGLFIIFFGTTLGSAIVFFFRRDINSIAKQIIFGFASGVMLSGSYFGLLAPSITEAMKYKDSYPYWLPAMIGFFIGGFLIIFLDFVSHWISGKKMVKNKEKSSEDLCVEYNEEADEKNRTKFSRSIKLLLAIIIHNIPEGIACGLEWGLVISKYHRNDMYSVYDALIFCVGIAIQDVPEGAAVSLPVRNCGASTFKGFIYGMLSGVVEPVFGVIAILISTAIESILPWALAFAAGAMIYVAVEELIPEAETGEKPVFGTLSMMFGFALMMIGDLLLG